MSADLSSVAGWDDVRFAVVVLVTALILLVVDRQWRRIRSAWLLARFYVACGLYALACRVMGDER